MTRTDLSGVYRGYLACLNRQDWTRLDQFVDDKVIYNGQQFGVERYRRMLGERLLGNSRPLFHH